MTDASVREIPSFSSGPFSLQWSHSLAAPPRGLALVRERNWVLTWDLNRWLYLLDHAGRIQAQRRLASLHLAVATDDASAYAAASRRGELWWLAPDLMPHWEKKLPQPAQALALDPFGKYLALSDPKGNVYLYDRPGKQIGELTLPRALLYLAFIPSVPLIVGSADLGLVAGFNFQGRVVWRDGLVATVGGLSTAGDGQPILLACFSDGLQLYDPRGVNQGKHPLPYPCRLVAQSFDGSRILTADLGSQLTLLDRQLQPLASQTMPAQIVALAIGALGKDGWVALANGAVMRLRWS